MEKIWYTPDLQLFGGEVAESGNGETGEKDAVAEQNSTQNVDLDKEFSELIGGKFKEQFTKKTQGLIDKRFKETKLLEYNIFRKKLMCSYHNVTFACLEHFKSLLRLGRSRKS